jgi:hypothetical protein
MLIYEEKIRYNPPIIKWISRGSLLLVFVPITLLFLLETGIVNWLIPQNWLYITLFLGILVFTGCQQVWFTLRVDVQGLKVDFFPFSGKAIQVTWAEIRSMQLVAHQCAIIQNGHRYWLGNSTLPVLHVVLKNDEHLYFSVDKIQTRLNIKNPHAKHEDFLKMN